MAEVDVFHDAVRENYKEALPEPKQKIVAWVGGTAN